MNKTQANKVLTDIFLPNEDELRIEVVVARVIAGVSTPDEKRQVEAWCAEDTDFRAEVEAQTKEFEKLTPVRLAGLEERILALAGVGRGIVRAEPEPRRMDVISDALREIFAGFRSDVDDIVRVLQGPQLDFRTRRTENVSGDRSAIARVLPTEDGVEIEVVSRNPQDDGARIEVSVSSSDWRAELTLSKVLPSSLEVRAAIRLSKEQIEKFPSGAEIRLRSAA